MIIEIGQYQEPYKMSVVPNIRSSLMSLNPLAEAEAYKWSVIAEVRKYFDFFFRVIKKTFFFFFLIFFFKAEKCGEVVGNND